MNLPLGLLITFLHPHVHSELSLGFAHHTVVCGLNFPLYENPGMSSLFGSSNPSQPDCGCSFLSQRGFRPAAPTSFKLLSPLWNPRAWHGLCCRGPSILAWRRTHLKITRSSLTPSSFIVGSSPAPPLPFRVFSPKPRGARGPVHFLLSLFTFPCDPNQLLVPS